MVGDSVNLPCRIIAVVLRDDHLYLVRYVSGMRSGRSVSFVTASCKENQDQVVLLYTFVALKSFQEGLDDSARLAFSSVKKWI